MDAQNIGAHLLHQGKSGIHPLIIAALRLAASVGTVWVVAQFLEPQSSIVVTQATGFSKDADR